MNEDDDKGNSCSTGDLNLCPICLGPIFQDSYLDKCFHKFCYTCIVQWTKVVAGKLSRPLPSVKCPLCKVQFDLLFFQTTTPWLGFFFSFFSCFEIIN
ncbi:hypothetical protein I3842_14G118500 [Carya illinoinensis]|uniref:RING-type domain-containing protein n=1 Tax=Carya illinoinensis TaxID=32201 RepID=A0A922ACN9_CARIL|nr:hypothetical protein I3842_14G118500 [Carya illinoinensis]